MPPRLTTAPMTDTIVVQSISSTSFPVCERLGRKLRREQFRRDNPDRFRERNDELERHRSISPQR